MKPSVGVAIIGGSGYGAGELLRYLTAHPQVRVASVVSSSQSGELISKAHPHLSGFYSGLKFESAVNWEQLKTFGQCVVFLALPHGHSGKFIHALGDSPHKDLRVIDLAADFRLSAESIHTRTYPDVQFDAPLRESFVYGLPELSQEKIKSARRITNPGCLATASILAAAPLIENYRELIVGSLCFDAKTGTSGAGRAAQDSMHHPLRHGNFEAYKILCHRHEPEIRQALSLGEQETPCMFVPHLLPTARGIFVTLYAQLRERVSQKEVLALYQKRFAKASFIRFRESSPSLHEVVGTNFCDMSVFCRDSQVVVLAALDNLGKGMAGQAIQNMNLMLGIEETTSLMQPALGIL